jgi:hypothetical protein
MEGSIRNIVKEEFDKVMSKKYSRDEVFDAILNKNFIYSKDGSVYSPVKFDHNYVVGVNDDCEHFNIHLDEITLIQSREERFKK